MERYDLPDHPDIRNIERTGYPVYTKPAPVCPNCGEECDELYIDDLSIIIGCECCVKKVDALEYLSQEE